MEEVELKTLYGNIEVLFPKTEMCLVRVFKGGDFRIGMWCVLRSETNPNTLDVGFWNNYHNRVEVTKYGLSLAETQAWLIARARSETESARKDEARRRREYAVLSAVIVLAACAALVWFAYR